MSQHTPTPWHLWKGKEGKFTVVSNDRRAIDAMDEADAALIVHRVNNFDALVEALEELMVFESVHGMKNGRPYWFKNDLAWRGFVDATEKARATLKRAKVTP